MTGSRQSDGTGRVNEVWRQALDLLDEVHGTFGLAYRDLGPGPSFPLGESFVWHGDDLFYPASVIKVSIMAEVFRRAEAGTVDLSGKLTVERDDQVGGSGVVQVLTPGVQLSVYDLVTLMIVVSDNTATNMLLDLVGPENVTRFMGELGLPNIRCYHKLMIVTVDREHSNLMSPADTTELMARIARDRVVSMRACQAMVDIMKKQQYHDHLTKYLPLGPAPSRATGSLPRLEVAHKNGWVEGSRLCTGIFYLPGRDYVLSLFSKDVEDDHAADEAIALVGKLVYQAVAAAG